MRLQLAQAMVRETLSLVRRYADSARSEIAACEHQLVEIKEEIATAQRATESLNIDTSKLRVRMKELELDEEMVKQSQVAAEAEKFEADQRLMKVGGYECAIRLQRRSLANAKRELQATQGAFAGALIDDRSTKLTGVTW